MAALRFSSVESEDFTTLITAMMMRVKSGNTELSLSASEWADPQRM